MVQVVFDTLKVHGIQMKYIRKTKYKFIFILCRNKTAIILPNILHI